MNDQKLLNIAAGATTLVKSGAGYLNRITINTTAAGAITVYDSLSATGTKIATLPSSAVVGSYEYGGRFSIGLTIVTAAASDITVTYQ